MSQLRKSKSANSAADTVPPKPSDEKKGLQLHVMPGDYCVARLHAEARLPRWSRTPGFNSITRTDDELSILCRQDKVPAGVDCERDWRLIKVLGTLDLSLIGVLASMAGPLAEAGIGLLTVSTFDTDYLMVRASKLDDAMDALEDAGHVFPDEGSAEDDGDRSGTKRTPGRSEKAGDEERTKKARRDRQADDDKPSGKKKKAGDKKPSEKKTSGKQSAEKKSSEKSPKSTRRRDAESEDERAPSRPRSSRQRSDDRRGRQPRGRGRRGARPGGSLYIGEEWEHVVADSEDEEPTQRSERSERTGRGGRRARGEESEPKTTREQEATRERKSTRERKTSRQRTSSRKRPSRDDASDERPAAEVARPQDSRDGDLRNEKVRAEKVHDEDETVEIDLRDLQDAANDAPDSDGEATEKKTSRTRVRTSPRRRRRQDAPRPSSRRPDDASGDGPDGAGDEAGDATSDGTSDETAQPSPSRRRAPKRAETPADTPTAGSGGDDRDDRPAALRADDELPADERDVVEDEGDNATGLYTGAIPQNPVETTEDDFASLGLSDRMVATLGEIGFIHPTPIQAAVLPMALEGSDIIGLAETGSGKTGAFGLPLAERLHHGRGVRGLILCPTREIALQTKAFLDIFGRDHELETAVIIGGVKFQPQISALRRHPDIIVATPGRLADHMRRGNVRLDKIEELVLDEADHMLDLGFLPQIQEIVARVPRDRRTMMFSATMPAAIERLAQRFLNDPYIADLRPVNRVASGIEHRLYLVESGHERPCLIGLLEEVDDTTLVFARRKLDTEFLARQLQLAGLPAERIHSDRTQAQRVAALRGFREGKKRILVATDVAARGIDVPHLGHVINFGMPDTVEDYVHRAGRTARGKAVGIVSSIGTWQDKPMVKEIERVIGQPIERKEVDGVKAYRELKPRRGRRRRRLL